ncbi:hypothetical protein LTR16_012784, partial [Cryomyces antarcticus]
LLLLRPWWLPRLHGPVRPVLLRSDLRHHQQNHEPQPGFLPPVHHQLSLHFRPPDPEPRGRQDGTLQHDRPVRPHQRHPLALPDPHQN